MKCLLVADIHYSLRQFDWIHGAASKFDLVIIAGDLLDMASAVDREAQIVVVLKYIRRILPQARLIVSSGNHDGNRAAPEDEPAARWLGKARAMGAFVDGDRLEANGTLFTICQWRGGPAASESIEQQLEADAQRECSKWIWIYHEPPQNTPVSWTGKRHFGDEQLVGWVERFKPDMVFSGHVHQAPFRSKGSWVHQIGPTWVFNMGQQIGPAPAFIVIDLDGEQAVWLSQAGEERVALSQPLSSQDVSTG